MRIATINIFDSNGRQLHHWTVPMSLFKETIADIARNELASLALYELEKQDGFDVVTFGLRLGFEFRE